MRTFLTDHQRHPAAIPTLRTHSSFVEMGREERRYTLRGGDAYVRQTSVQELIQRAYIHNTEKSTSVKTHKKMFDRLEHKQHKFLEGHPNRIPTEVRQHRSPAPRSRRMKTVESTTSKFSRSSSVAKEDDSRIKPMLIEDPRAG